MSWLTAAQALQVLGVRPQTLYANVSRRKIRAKPDPKDTRRSLYHEVDVRKLARRRGGRRKAETVAAGAIEWGDPILSSALSTVADGRLWYRGMDAVALSENGTLEEIAALLWGTESVVQVAGDGRVSDGGRQSGGGHSGGDNTNASPVTTEPLRRAFVALGTRASGDASSHGRALSVLQTEAAGVLETLVGAMLPGQGARLSGGDGRPRRARLPTTRQRATPLHHRVAASWERASAADVVRRVLVLLADHELNASTFATRVTISTGAPLAAGVLSGLATLSGPLHGQAALGVLELIAGVEREGAGGAVRDWLAQGARGGGVWASALSGRGCEGCCDIAAVRVAGGLRGAAGRGGRSDWRTAERGLRACGHDEGLPAAAGGAADFVCFGSLRGVVGARVGASDYGESYSAAGSVCWAGGSVRRVSSRCASSTACRSLNLSASLAGLSVRRRAMRGKRRAMPDLWRLEAAMPS